MYDYSAKGLNPENELREYRHPNKKLFKDGDKYRVIVHGKNVHFWSDEGEGENPEVAEWEDIDLTPRVVGVDGKKFKDHFLVEKNAFTVGFRGDGAWEKMSGVRFGEGHQIEYSIRDIILDGEKIDIGESAKKVTGQYGRMVHEVADGMAIEHKLHEHYIRDAVKIDRFFKRATIISEIHLKGFTVTNDLKDGAYIPDDKGGFTFRQDGHDKEIWMPLPLMWDTSGRRSNDISHTLTVDDGKLLYTKTITDAGEEWLINSEFPVWVDGTAYYSTTNDGLVIAISATSYSDVMALTTGTANTVQTENSMAAGLSYGDKNYYCVRAFLYMDLSGFGAGTVGSCDLKLYGYDLSESNAAVQKGTQGDTLVNDDFNNFTGSEYGHTTSWSTSGYNTISFNSTGISDLNTAGITKLCVREYEHDYSNSAPSQTSAPFCRLGFYFADYTGTSRDPYLDITLSGPSISKVSGVAKASISKVGGVSLSGISKISGSAK